MGADAPLGLGVDLGTSGLRLALIDPSGAGHAELEVPYPAAFEDPAGWREGLIALCACLDPALRARVAAIALDGTSGTLLLCRPDGAPAPGALGLALPYHQSCPEQAAAAAALAGLEAAGTPAASASGSLARALALIAAAEQAGLAGPWLLRHQADWLMGWLLGDWRWGEEGNNLRLGWDLHANRWCGRIAAQPWSEALPEICPSGTRLGPLAAPAAAALGLPSGCMVVAGSTDASAAVLAADPQPGDGITVLGTTLVLKQFSPQPSAAPASAASGWRGAGWWGAPPMPARACCAASSAMGSWRS
jgi:sugar (pentulose or hexulose) kinase